MVEAVHQPHMFCRISCQSIKVYEVKDTTLQGESVTVEGTDLQIINGKGLKRTIWNLADINKTATTMSQWQGYPARLSSGIDNLGGTKSPYRVFVGPDTTTDQGPPCRY